MNRRDSGFTLIELVVVVAILALLAAAAVPTATAIEAGEKYALARDEMRGFATAVCAYARDTVAVPSDMVALVANAAATGGWQGPYLTTATGGAPNDPWGAPYALTSLGGTRVRVSSAGPDRVAGTADDASHDVDVAPEFRARTQFVVDTVNRAIALHNGRATAQWTALPANVDTLVSTLRTEGYLNASVDWTVDALGAKLTPGGSPVTFVYAGSAPAGGAGGSSGADDSGGSGGGGSSGRGDDDRGDDRWGDWDEDRRGRGRGRRNEGNGNDGRDGGENRGRGRGRGRRNG
jgi:general secretion pathway protein G